MSDCNNKNSEDRLHHRYITSSLTYKLCFESSPLVIRSYSKKLIPLVFMEGVYVLNGKGGDVLYWVIVIGRLSRNN